MSLPVFWDYVRRHIGIALSLLVFGLERHMAAACMQVSSQRHVARRQNGNTLHESTQVLQLATQMSSMPRMCTETGFNHIEKMCVVFMSV